MDELLSQKQQPASSQTLNEVASQLPHGLPDALRKLLSKMNGGHVSADAVLRVPDGSTAGAISILPAEKIVSVTQTILGSGADRTVWARDGNGNTLTVDSDGFVYFWDHDTDRELPFGCKIDELHRHFFRRPVGRQAVASPTAAALDKMLTDAAPLDAISAFLRDALTSETVGAFMMTAARHGRADVVRAITAQAEPSAVDFARALSTAAERCQLEVAEALLVGGTDINARDPRSGLTALMAAASAGRQDAVGFLLDRGADASLTTNRGRTAAQMAMTSSNPQLAELIAARAGG